MVCVWITPLHRALCPPFHEVWEHVYMFRLKHETKKCKILVVVITPALYKSYVTLLEIYTAITQKVKLLPILFEGPIPKKKDMWPFADRPDDMGEPEHVHMVDKVHQYFCKLNMYPPPGDEDSGIAHHPTLLRKAGTKIESVLTRLLRAEAGLGAVERSTSTSSRGRNLLWHRGGRLSSSGSSSSRGSSSSASDSLAASPTPLLSPKYSDCA